MSLKNILVFRIGHLGDTVLALPALWTIRENFPSSHITLLTNIDRRNPGYVSPLDVLPEEGIIDASIAYPTNLGSLQRAAAFATLVVKLRRRKFDAVVYLMPRIRSGKQIDRDLRFFRLCGIKRSLGAEYLRANGLPPVIPRPTPTAQHEADFMLSLLKDQGLDVDLTPRTDLGLTAQEKEAARSWLANAAGNALVDKRLIAIAPGSKWKSKVWYEDRFAAVGTYLISKLNCFPVIVGGPDDREAGKRLIAGWQTGCNAAGSLSIRESAALLEMCELYLGNDTGTMHLAAAVGTPCVATFAALDWIGRWTPFGTPHVVFRKSVACEGCQTPDCFNDHECLDLIGTDEVFDACVEMLKRKR